MKPFQKNISPRKLWAYMMTLYYTKEGKSQQFIADKLGVSRQSIGFNLEANKEYQVDQLPFNLVAIAARSNDDDDVKTLQAAAVVIMRLIEEIRAFAEEDDKKLITEEGPTREAIERFAKGESVNVDGCLE